MPIAQLELVMLENGDVALQHADSDEPLVSIRFSPEVLDYLGQRNIDVAKQMIDAGIQAVSELNEADHGSSEELFEEPQTLH